MKKLLLILNNLKAYKYWLKKRKGQKFKDWNRGVGYYLPTVLLGLNPVGEIFETEMYSGKIGLYELIEYKTFSDPHDMVKEAWYDFIGYKDETPMAKCKFEEFISIYVKIKK